MNKFISVQEAVDMIKDGDTIMVGGFLAVGTPLRIIDALAQSGKKNLTLICNDTGYPDRGVGKLITNKQVSKLYVSHIGTNQNTIDQMNAGELKVEFCPQGTLAERIRCGGAMLPLSLFHWMWGRCGKGRRILRELMISPASVVSVPA